MDKLECLYFIKGTRFFNNTVTCNSIFLSHLVIRLNYQNSVMKIQKNNNFDLLSVHAVLNDWLYPQKSAQVKENVLMLLKITLMRMLRLYSK